MTPISLVRSQYDSFCWLLSLVLYVVDREASVYSQCVVFRAVSIAHKAPPRPLPGHHYSTVPALGHERVEGFSSLIHASLPRSV